MGAQGGNLEGLFLTTLSVRRATKAKMYNFNGWCISIHALREESDLSIKPLLSYDTISIHALREESDLLVSNDFHIIEFLSTLSVRRATFACVLGAILGVISIHALREESDTKVLPIISDRAHFYPRSP